MIKQSNVKCVVLITIGTCICSCCGCCVCCHVYSRVLELQGLCITFLKKQYYISVSSG